MRNLAAAQKKITLEGIFGFELESQKNLLSKVSTSTKLKANLIKVEQEIENIER